MRILSVMCDGVEFFDKAPIVGKQALITHPRGYIRGTYIGCDKTHYGLVGCTFYTDFGKGKGLEKMESCPRAWVNMSAIIRVP
jgi:hypothetical protein